MGTQSRLKPWARRFGVKGYPTMIVLNPDGEEVTRIPGGIDIDRYNSVLRNSLNSMRPTSELMAAASANPDSLNAAEYTQLAYYSWGQDDGVLAEDYDPEIFRKLSEHSAQLDEIASTRLFMQYLEASSERNSDETPVKLKDVDARLEQILRSDELTIASWDSLAYTPQIMKILDVSDERRQVLTNLWKERTMALRHDPSLSTVEQLAGWRPTLIFHSDATEEPISTELARELDADIAKANESVTDRYARQGLVHQMKWTYQYARMNDKARALMLAELDQTPTPYYFMSGIGSLAEEEGNSEEALEWYRKAWEISEGPATRFSVGYKLHPGPDQADS